MSLQSSNNSITVKKDEQLWEKSLIEIAGKAATASIWDSYNCPQNWTVASNEVVQWLEQGNDDSRSKLITWILHLSARALDEWKIDKTQLLNAMLNKTTHLTLDTIVYSTPHEVISELADALGQNTTVTQLTYKDSTEIGWACLLCESTASNLTSLVLDLAAPLWSPELSERLTNALQQMPSLTALKWICGKLDSKNDFAEMIAPVLAKNTTLIHLDLSGNQLGDTSVLRIVNSLRKHPSLAKLNLAGNGINESATVKQIADLLNKGRLTHLYLDGNKAVSVGISHITSALKTDKTLAVLSLTRTTINEEGTNRLKNELKEELQGNSTITKLFIDRREVNRVGLLRGTSQVI